MCMILIKANEGYVYEAMKACLCISDRMLYASLLPYMSMLEVVSYTCCFVESCCVN